MGRQEVALKHGEITEEILRAFYAVYNELGCGFLESVYEKAMWLALAQANVPAEAQSRVTVWFREHSVGEFRADLIVQGKVLVELKCAKGIDPAHEAQVMNYLRATDLEVGLLLNFGPEPQFRRFVFENHNKKPRHPR
jgi:GxxExxY protein